MVTKLRHIQRFLSMTILSLNLQTAVIPTQQCCSDLETNKYTLYTQTSVWLWHGCPRLVAKLEEKVTELDAIHNDINSIYSNGAVEGYSDQKLGSSSS